MQLFFCVLAGGLIGLLGSSHNKKQRWSDNFILGLFGSIGGLFSLSGRVMPNLLSLDIYGILAAILGAIVLLLVSKMVAG